MNGIGEGPEDITLGKDGYFYTGLQDGRVMRFRDDQQPEEYANTGGRPLGMQFDADGNLIVGYRWFKCYIAGKPRVLNGYS